MQCYRKTNLLSSCDRKGTLGGTHFKLNDTSGNLYVTSHPMYKKCCMNGMFQQQDKSFGGTAHVPERQNKKRSIGSYLLCFFRLHRLNGMSCLVAVVHMGKWSYKEGKSLDDTKLPTTHMCLLWDAICSFPVRGAVVSVFVMDGWTWNVHAHVTQETEAHIKNKFGFVW